MNRQFLALCVAASGGLLAGVTLSVVFDLSRDRGPRERSVPEHSLDREIETTVNLRELAVGPRGSLCKLTRKVRMKSFDSDVRRYAFVASCRTSRGAYPVVGGVAVRHPLIGNDVLYSEMEMDSGQGGLLASAQSTLAR